MFLPDVNLWLALAFESHFHHQAAKNWFVPISGGTCWFCRMTQQGFLRLATNPKAFGEEAPSLSQAWVVYDALLADPRIAFASEPAGIEPLWRGYTARESFSPKLWNDAFLAAFARASSLELVTFDNGFRQFEGLNCTILT